MFLSQFVYSLQVCVSLFQYACVFVYVYFVHLCKHYIIIKEE